MDNIQLICEKLGITGEIKNVSYFSSGHINSTFKVDVDNCGKIKSYVVQQINTFVFTNPKELMQNILSVTDYIYNKDKAHAKSLKFLKTPSTEGFIIVDGLVYRAYEYVNNSKTFDLTDNLDLLYETGLAFGEFQTLLNDFPIENLHESIPQFHDTIKRFCDFDNAINQNQDGRSILVGQDIIDFLALREKAEITTHMLQNGELKLRVTHNDTKCNNVLFDKHSNKHICVIDLDTVMPGLVINDFGDSIRFSCNSSTEDEADLSKVYLDLEKFKAFTHGFLDGAGKILTKQELDLLPLGAITMTIECGVRFLTDYLNGDKYFKIEYPEQNLFRARCQLRLAQDMIKNEGKMKNIVMSFVNGKELH